MLKRQAGILLILMFFIAQHITAQQLPSPILLWPQGAPGASGTTDEDKPAITPFVPEGNKRNGAAILVVPGGGFTIRAVDHEGVLVAQWLKDHGITAFLLRYRLRPIYEREHWLKDGQRAMQYIRSHASEYNIAPERVGAVGFSAGANLIADLAFNPVAGQADAKDPLDRFNTQPNFLILSYGSAPMPPTMDGKVQAGLPPVFMFSTTEDAGSIKGMSELYAGLVQANVPAEAHFFRNGVHGSGFAIGDPVLGAWPDLMLTWVQAGGFLTNKQRFALNGIVKLDGTPLLRGIIVLTNVEDPNAPPVVVYMTNTGTGELGRFSVPLNQGPVAGKYKVVVRQEATRWTSNSRDPFMIKMMDKQRNNNLTDADRKEWSEYLRKRDLSPSIDNQKVFARQRPGDKVEYIVDIKEGKDVVLEVFSR
ncbi:MAG TPA: alpha/beta hydrolase [Cyclobacteriaceae bacterium]|nr:alpha/beta hydrolase [Cyclobacteriaceae bacterium]